MDTIVTTEQPFGADRYARIQRLAGGRRIGYAEYGDPEGLPVFALHGTPGSRSMFALSDRLARDAVAAALYG
jgi:pimeloyl-ACP methyl ester carboxylesterase